MSGFGFNPFEETARLEKALKLADFLQFEVGIANSKVARSLKDFQWKLAAAAARVKEPSALTREKVVEILARREKITCEGLRLDPYFSVRGEDPEGVAE